MGDIIDNLTITRENCGNEISEQADDSMLLLSRNYERVAAALEYVTKHHLKQPTLSEVANHVGLSDYHFQRLFTHWVGITPKKFLQYLTLEEAKLRLTQSASVLDAAISAGLSGPARLHDLFVTCVAVTPGEYKLRGSGLTIRYGFHPTPFGECLLMITDRGVCGLSFVTDCDRGKAFNSQQRGWENAKIVADQTGTRAYVEKIFKARASHERRGQIPSLRLLLRGTQFQIKVWEALLNIPIGSLTSYEGLAQKLGYRTGARAIGQAVGKNVIAYLIPCHRVIRKSGLTGDYHWGAARKLAMIGWEAATIERETP